MVVLPRTPALAGVLLLGALLFGCAAPQTRALLDNAPPGLPPRVELTATPFYPQEIHQCGPAALATALASADVPLSADVLAAQVYVPGREGSLQPEMLAAVRRNGLVAYRLAPRIDDVLAEVAAGTPVVVLQNLSFAFAPMWHYAVVIGYDVSREEIVLRSGVTKRLTLSFSQFERTWARSGYWAILALPAERLPATALEDDFVAAIVALERSSAPAARRAYLTALDRWPQNLVARLGQGNTAYAMNDIAEAEVAYRRAVADHPDAADAWNNLAQALSDQDRRAEAIAAAERALTIGGPRRAVYETTLQDVSRKR